jgi:hypothetical protein
LIKINNISWLLFLLGKFLVLAEEHGLLGLFKGTSTNFDGSPTFDLDRAPTRCEAAVMLVRLLGMESNALKWNYSHPFKDVESWARPYVGHLLSNCTSDTTYGSNDSITTSQFITLVLRALGYISGTDFQ